MDEGTIGLVLGLCVACVAFLAWRIERQGYALQAKVDETAQKIEAKTHPDIPDFTELREDLEELITDTIGSMRSPQIADHIGAVLAQWAQVKMHKEMQALQMIPALADVTEPESDQ